MSVQLLHFFDSDFSKGGGYSACSRVFSWVFLSGKISAIGLFVWYYLLLGMCIEVGDIMFFFLHQECANQPTFTSASFFPFFSIPRCTEINPKSHFCYAFS